MSSDPINNLPSPVESAGTIAKLVTSVAFAFTAVWYPEAGIAGAVLPFIIDRYVNRPKHILLEELKKGNIQDLSAEQFAPLCPMTYKFLEAAKEGEHERNLRILAAYLVGELKQKTGDEAAAKLSRMVRRVEGLSDIDLKVMALIDIWLSTIVKPPTDEDTTFAARFESHKPFSNKKRGKCKSQHWCGDLPALRRSFTCRIDAQSSPRRRRRCSKKQLPRVAPCNTVHPTMRAARVVCRAVRIR